MTRRTRAGSALAALAAVAVALAGCGVTRGDTDRDLVMMIPNSPGGGYDLTGRAAVRVMEDLDVTGGDFQVENIIGASGSRAAAQLMNEDGDSGTVMTVGLGVVGALYSFGADYDLADATPIAQLIEEQEGILVPAGSPFRTVDDLVDAWTDDPASVTVGGGSSPGGPDHLFPMQLADTLGIDPGDVAYTPYDGGGPLTSALLGDKIDVGFSGLGEFEGSVEAGDLRVLAVSGEERIEGGVYEQAPTLIESGIDFSFANWRGILAPPGISEERQAELIDYFAEMRASDEWQEALLANGWIDAWKPGEKYRTFLTEQDERVAQTLEELGLI